LPKSNIFSKFPLVNIRREFWAKNSLRLRCAAFHWQILSAVYCSRNWSRRRGRRYGPTCASMVSTRQHMSTGKMKNASYIVYRYLLQAVHRIKITTLGALCM